MKKSIFSVLVVLALVSVGAGSLPQGTPSNALQAVDLTPVGGQLCVQLGDSLYCWDVTQSTLTVTPVPNTATPTLASATRTPTPTRTKTSTPTVTVTGVVSPTRTPTASSGSIPPFANAPACPTHDTGQWHGLWDYAQGCHYDHTHGDDPALANAYFGPLGALWGGATISYPFKSSEMENTMKHAGYKISVRQPGYHDWLNCGNAAHVTDIGRQNCIVASRIQYHAVGGLMDLVARYHSYWMELYVCRGDPVPFPQPGDPNCGIVRTGGLLDYAQLQAPHYNARIFRPGGTLDFGNGMVMAYDADASDLPARSGEPYIFSQPYTSEYINLYRNNSPHGRGAGTAPGSYSITIDQWSSNDFDCEFTTSGACHNQYTHILFQVGDSFNLVDPQNLNTVRWICYGQANCEYDGSMIGMNEVAVRILQNWQPSGGGFVTFTGWSDRWGNPRLTGNTCTTATADCVPFILEHAPVGVAGVKSNRGCLCDVWEYDVYFNNRPSGWIKFPN